MANQLTTNAEALRLFFTDDVYVVKDEAVTICTEVEEPKVEIAAKADKMVMPKIEKQETFEFKYLGKNGRSILILVNDGQNDVSTEQGRELLRNIVKAINLTNADFALVNYAKYQGASFSVLNSYFSPVLMLAFGVKPETLGLTTQPENQLVNQGNTAAVFAQNLDVLADNLLGKKQLWASLKQINI